MEKHDVDIAEGIELAPAVAAKGKDGKGGRGGASIAHGVSNSGLEDVLHEDVDEVDPKRADFTAAPAVLMAEPEPMLLDFEELFVERKRIRGRHRPGGSELALSMSENFSEMTGCGHLGMVDFRLQNVDWCRVWLNLQSTI
jgi:hypothetical protein